MTWLSPAFPVGAFAYSHGIERAIHDGVIAIAQAWSAGSPIWSNAVRAGTTPCCWPKRGARLRRVRIARRSPSLPGRWPVRASGTWRRRLQGEAFASAAKVWNATPICRTCLSQEGDRDLDAIWEIVPYPVAVGRPPLPLPLTASIARGCAAAYLHAFTSNLVQAAVRLVPLGQRDGVSRWRDWSRSCWRSRRAAQSTLDDLGSATFLSEIMSMRHEVQYSRVFRS
jgi:urease accessory protein